MVQIVPLAIAILVPLSGGMLGGLATRSQITTWYARLRRPSWNPPNWLFGPVWTVLYALMGVASYLVWTHGGFQAQARPLTLYALQLALNFAWTPLFFSLHRLDLATLDILAMWAAIVATIRAFYPVIGTTALGLLLPYLAWVSYASALTVWIWRHNLGNPKVQQRQASPPQGSPTASLLCHTPDTPSQQQQQQQQQQ